MIEELLSKLNSEEPSDRLYSLNELKKYVDEFDKTVVINALKPLILDWDDEVRLKVAEVLKFYTGR